MMEYIIDGIPLSFHFAIEIQALSGYNGTKETRRKRFPIANQARTLAIQYNAYVV